MNTSDLKTQYLIEQRLAHVSDNHKYKFYDYQLAYELNFKNFIDNKYKDSFLKYFKSKTNRFSVLDGATCFLGFETVGNPGVLFVRFIPEQFEDQYCREKNIHPFFVYDMFHISYTEFTEDDYEITNDFNYTFKSK